MNFKTLKENYNTWGTEKNIKSGILPVHTVLSTVLVKSKTKVRYILTIFPTIFHVKLQSNMADTTFKSRQ